MDNDNLRQLAEHYGLPEGITLSRTKKFDIQIKHSHLQVLRLVEMFAYGEFLLCREDVRIEVKSEQHQWEKSNRIAVEYGCDGKPSGILTTEATTWAHQLLRNGIVMNTMLIPTWRMRELARIAVHEMNPPSKCTAAGDGKRFRVALINLATINRRLDNEQELAAAAARGNNAG
jgi:hypothetical protein